MSTSEFLAERLDLLADWLTKIPVLAHLSFAEQQTIHDFFAFTQSLNDKEALAHRRLVTITHCSLPSRAGKAMKRFANASLVNWDAVRTQQAVQQKGRCRALRAMPVFRATPDLDAIAQVVMNMAVHQLEQENREKKDAA